MIAGQTDMPVGTVATNPDVATGDGSDSGVEATTGARRISRGAAVRSVSVARYARNITPAAAAATTTYDIRDRRGVTSRGDARSRASSRARKSGDVSMVGRLFTSIRLRRTSMSCRAHT